MARRQDSGDDLAMRGFGERLRLLREAYAAKYGAEHHSRGRWAQRLHVSREMYGRWEAGKNLPKFEDMLRISLLYRVDPNYLIAGVLSEYMPRWIYDALRKGNPQLLDAVDYWKDQSEAFQRASRATSDSPPDAKPDRSGAVSPQNRSHRKPSKNRTKRQT